MRYAAGLYVGGDTLTAVVADLFRPGHRVSHTVPWNRDTLSDAIAQLRRELPAPSRIGVTIGSAHLQLLNVRLPRVAPAEQRRMLALQPDRFFPGRSSHVVVALLAANAAGGHHGQQGTMPAASVDADLMEAVIACCERWAPVHGVIPAPAAIGTRYMPVREGRLVIPRDTSGATDAVEVLVHGRGVREVRRTQEDTIPDLRTALVSQGPAGATIGRLFADAALHAGDAPEAVQLVPANRSAQILGRRYHDMVWSATVVAAAVIGMALGTAWQQRRQVGALERTVQVQQDSLAGVRAAYEQLQRLSAERSQTAGLAAQQPPVLSTLRLLTSRLPDDVVMNRVRFADDRWELAGSAGSAATVLRILEETPGMREVRTLAPANRYVEDGAAREGFSIGFQRGPQ